MCYCEVLQQSAAGTEMVLPTEISRIRETIIN